MARIGPDVGAAFALLLALIALLSGGFFVLGCFWLFGISPAAWMGWLCGGSLLGFIFAIALGAFIRSARGG